MRDAFPSCSLYASTWRLCFVLLIFAATADQASPEQNVTQIAKDAVASQVPSWASRVVASASWFLSESPLELAIAASRRYRGLDAAGLLGGAEGALGLKDGPPSVASSLTSVAPLLLFEAGATTRTTSTFFSGMLIMQVVFALIFVCVLGGIVLDISQADDDPTQRQAPPRQRSNLLSPSRHSHWSDTQQSLRATGSVRQMSASSAEPKAVGSAFSVPRPQTDSAIYATQVTMTQRHPSSPVGSIPSAPADSRKYNEEKLCPNLNVPTLANQLCFSIDMTELARLSRGDAQPSIDILGPSGARLFFGRLVPGEAISAEYANAGPWFGVSTSPKTKFLHASIGPLQLPAVGGAQASHPLHIRGSPSSASQKLWSGIMDSRSGEWQVRKDGRVVFVIETATWLGHDNGHTPREAGRSQLECRRLLSGFSECITDSNGSSGGHTPVAWADIVRNPAVGGSEALRVQVADRSDYMLSLVTMITVIISNPEFVRTGIAASTAPAARSYSPTMTTLPGTSDRMPAAALQWKTT